MTADSRGFRGPLVAPSWPPRGPLFRGNQWNQMERRFRKSLQKSGFSPLQSTRLHVLLDWGSRGPEFESRRPDWQKGLVIRPFRVSR
jgi:hypothetical protein